MKKYVVYYRVSTQRQNASHLGLEAQKSIVDKFVSSEPDSKVIAEYTEIESGRNIKRQVLKKALVQCKQDNATLLIAKLDRLARNVSFVFSLRDSGIPFVACDLPNFNTLTLGIFASSAQYEAELISQRIKEALNAKKARGEKLGSPRPMLESTREKGRKAFKENSKEKLEQTYKVASKLREAGNSFAQIATSLNDCGFVTVRERKFTAAAVRNMLLLFRYNTLNPIGKVKV